MKKIVSLVLALILAGSFAAAFSSCSSQETLVVCNWGEYISEGEDGYMDVVAEFEKKYNCKVEYVVAETNETLYSLMKSGSVQYDVIFPSDYMIEKMIKEDMLAKIDFENVPNFKNILSEFKNPEYDPQNEYSVPYFWGTVGLVYNETLLTPEDLAKVEKGLKDFELLWSKEYPNQIMMFNNPRDAFGVALKTLGYSQNTTSEKELREAADKLKSQNFLYYMDEFFTEMPNDALALGVYYAGDYLTVAAENEHLKFVIPECGTNIFNDAMCIPKNAKNKSLAEKFIDFMLTPEVGKDNAEYLGYSSPNTAALALMDDEVKNDPIAYPTRQKNWEAFRDLPAETNELIRDLWAEILTSNNK